MSTSVGPCKLTILKELKYGDYFKLKGMGEMIFQVIKPIITPISASIVSIVDTKDGQQLNVDGGQEISRVSMALCSQT